VSPSVLRLLARFLLPNACVACDGPVEQRTPDALVCGVCRSRLRRVTGGCRRCHQPEPPVGPCRFCAEWPSALAAVHSAVWLDHEAREILHHLKYDGLPLLGETVARIVASAVSRPRVGVVVPVPLSSRRERERGYNQATAIAAPLAARWQLPLGEGLLRRQRHTRSQTALRPEERRTNVHDAFAAEPPPSGPMPLNEPVILIDDVLTTGATLAAAATTLARAGWVRIEVVTFARALPFVQRIR
jgi:ComF family protein